MSLLDYTPGGIDKELFDIDCPLQVAGKSRDNYRYGEGTPLEAAAIWKNGRPEGGRSGRSHILKRPFPKKYLIRDATNRFG